MKKIKGFTLVEVSIVMIIVGLMIAAGMAFQNSIMIKERASSTKTRIAAVENAIDAYVANAGTLPCPAALDAPMGSPAFGTATDCNITTVAPGSCNASYCVAAGRLVDHDNNPATLDVPLRVRIGAVPARSLSMPFDTAKDGWGNRLLYVVTEKLAQSPSSYDVTHGAIDVVDDTGNTVLSQPGSAHYIVLSPGSDQVGGYNFVSGVRVAACTTGNATQDEENCDNDSTFRSALYADTGAAAHYDDMINYVANVAPAAGPPPSSGGGGAPLILWTGGNYDNGFGMVTTTPLACPAGYTEVYNGEAVTAYSGSANSAASGTAIGETLCSKTMAYSSAGPYNLLDYAYAFGYKGNGGTIASMRCTVCVPN
jgi:prepilin-type N-terminal cleavage/methylation domain-containing protein